MKEEKENDPSTNNEEDRKGGHQCNNLSLDVGLMSNFLIILFQNFKFFLKLTWLAFKCYLFI